MGRRPWIAVALVLVVVAPARGGFYEPRNPTSPLVASSGVRPLAYEQLRDELNRLLVIGDPLRPQGPREAALKTRDELLARRPGLSPTDAAALGAVQWRLRDGDGALTTLREAYNRDPRNFWVLTHLASVQQALGQFREAASPLETARDFVPDPWPAGATTGAWFKKVEGYQFKLIRLRLSESAGRPAGRPVPAADVDALFGVRFVGPAGRYEAGTIADAERTKLPPDAIAIVQQLLLWFPEDTRLLWLLGELYNADGNLEAASKVLDQCVWSRRFESPTLREHRRVVQEAYESQLKADAETPESPKPEILPETWHLWTVGSLFGVVLVLLAYYQVRELLRRVRSRRPPNDPGER